MCKHDAQWEVPHAGSRHPGQASYRTDPWADVGLLGCNIVFFQKRDQSYPSQGHIPQPRLCSLAEQPKMWLVMHGAIP